MDLSGLVEALATVATATPKEIDIVALGCATDEAIHTLNAAGSLGFALHDGNAISYANVRGNPWDFAEVVDRARATSRALPEQRFTLSLQPDGSTTALRAGTFDDDDGEYAALAEWVVRWPRPVAPDGELHASLSCEIDPSTRLALRAMLAGRALGRAVTFTDRPGAPETPTVISITSAPEIVAVLDAVTRAICNGGDGWHCTLELTGVVHATCKVHERATLFALGVAIDALVRDRPRTVSSAPVIAIAASPALAAIVAPEQLELEIYGDTHGTRFALGREGDFVELPPRARTLVRELGSVGTYRITSELVDRQLGRQLTVISIHADDGSVRTGEPLINATAVMLDADADRVLATMELDGVLELVAIDVATLRPTTLRALADRPAPQALYVHNGAILGLVSSPSAVKLVALADDAVLASIPHRLRILHRTADRLLLVTTSTEADNEAPAAHLHELSLDGALATVLLGSTRQVDVSFAGDWLTATSDMEPDAQVYERLALRRTIPAVSTRHTWSLDVSPTGAIARVTQGAEDNSGAELEVFRESARVAIAVPRRTGACWRTA